MAPAGSLAEQIREAALLEGDFLLRSGKRSSYYLDKYRFGTRPDLLRPIGKAIAEAVREHEADAVRLAAPELGAVTLATAAALELDLPFVIVRSRAKEYGTANRIEGAFDHGDCVCLVEDVVTSGGAAIEAVEALREAGMRVSNAVCVVVREKGAVAAHVYAAARLGSLLI